MGARMRNRAIQEVAVSGWWAVSYVALWIVVGALCVIVVALARQIGTLHLRLGPRGALELDGEGPPLGAVVEPIELIDSRGGPVTVAARGEAQLLLFVSPGCTVCDDVIPAARAVSRGNELSAYVLSDSTLEEAAAVAERSRLRVPVVPAPELARELEVPGTPYVLVLDGAGAVRAKGTVNNLEQVEGLALTAQRRASSPGQEARAA
jgi:methylamine dehydrogenase accessory protein MauD